MNMRVALDLGSTALKLAILDDKRTICLRCAPTAPGQEALARQLLRDALTELGVNGGGAMDGMRIAVTGYGKRLFAGADRTLDEISANALGAFLGSAGRARVVVNIGGQDLKVIRLDEKRARRRFPDE